MRWQSRGSYLTPEAVSNVLEIVRFLILAGVILRFHADSSSLTPLGLSLLFLVLLCLFGYDLFLLVMVRKFPQLRASDRWIQLQIVMDAFFANVFILFTGDVQSDFFLLHLYPLLLASTSLRFHTYSKAAITFLVISALYLIVILIIPSPLEHHVLFVRTFAPRATFFAIVTGIVVVYSVSVHNSLMIVGIQRNRLERQRKELTTSNHQLSTLRDIANLLTNEVASINLPFLIVNKCKDLLAAQSVHLRILDEQILRLVAGTGEYWNHLDTGIDTRTSNVFPFVEAFLNERIYIATDSRQDEYFMRVVAETNSDELRTELDQIGSFICLPLVAARDRIGILTISFSSRNATSKQVVDVANDFGRVASSVLRNAALIDEGRELREFYEEYSDSPADISLQHRLQVVTDTAISLLAATSAQIYSLTSDKHYLRLEATSGPASNTISIGKIISPTDGIIVDAITLDRTIIDNSVSKFDVGGIISIKGLRSILVSPYHLHKRVAGVIVIMIDESDQRGFFTLTAEKLVIGLAKRIMTIARNEQVRRRERFLFRISQELPSTLEVGSVSGSILRLLREEIPYHSASLQEFRRNSFTITDCEGFDTKTDVIGRTYSIDDPTPNREIYLKRDCIPYSDIREDFPLVTSVPDSASIRSWLGIPLFVANQIVGMISLDRRGDINPFTGDEVEFAKAFGRYASIALNNAKDYTVAQVLYDIARSVGTAEDQGDIGKALLNGIRKLVPCTSASLQVIERDGDNRRIIASIGFDTENLSAFLLRPLSQDILISKITRTMEARVISVVDESAEDWQILPETAHVKSWIGVPLVYGKQVIGIITLDHTQPGYFQLSDLDFVNLVTGQAAISVANYGLLHRLDLQLKHLHDVESLAMIGLIYGEDLHLTSNKLSAARQFAKYILSNESTSEAIRQYATYIDESISEVIALIASIADTVRAPDVEQVLVAETAEDVIAAMRIPANVRVEWRVPSREISVLGYKTQISQVMRVIIFNALQAMNGEGTLTVSMERGRDDSKEHVVISISDTGTGIPAHIQPFVFEIGKKYARKRQRGFGFGLAWSRLFLRWFGGDLSFVTENGKGTTMNIFLPSEFNPNDRIT